MADTAYEISSESVEGRSVLTLHGEFDLRNASEVEAAIIELHEGGAPALVVDLSGATFLDSLMFGVLKSGSGRFGRDGRNFILVKPGEKMWAVFELTGISDSFRACDSREDAIAALVPGDG